LARTSWNVPIDVFATRIPRNRASLGLPNAIVIAPKIARIRLKTVNVFAIAIER
jgi:hypothetical protein